MSNYIPREINIDRSDANKLIISNNKKELALTDYLAFLFVGFLYFGCIYFYLFFFLTQINIFSSIIILAIFYFSTRLLVSLIISLKEKQSIIITEKFIEIVKNRPFFSKYYKLDRANIKQINFEVFGFIALFLPSAITSFKYHCNLKYYEAPRIVHKDGEVYIFEHFRHKVRKWIVDELNDELK
jgi:hypothetical protein